MMRGGGHALVCALVAGSVATAPDAGSDELVFSGVGRLPGAVLSEARGVSADGTVVVGRSGGPTGMRAFRWGDRGFAARGFLDGGFADGELEPLDDLPGGFGASAAYAVSADGREVVGASDSQLGLEAVRWSDGRIERLGDLPGGRHSGQAFAVSADGTRIAGKSSSSDGTAAFLWRMGELQSLGDLPGDEFSSQALGISGDGRVVAGGGYGPLGLEAFRWTEQEGLVGLGDLREGVDVAVRERPQAYAASADGSVLVGATSSLLGPQAFRWTQEHGMAGLGHLGTLAPGAPGEVRSSTAFGVSADGQTVVGTSTSAAGFAAFIWTPERGMLDLRRVIEDELGLGAGGWTLEAAYAVSADGTTVVGRGRNPAGDTEGWRAVIAVPEPSAVALELAAYLALLAIRPCPARVSPRAPGAR